jgi:serine/threonine-protein kinase
MARWHGPLVVAITFLVASACAPASAQQYRTYSNARFGTTAEVPADWKPDPPPANGDGLIFRSPDRRASVTVSGSLHVWNSIDEAMKIYEQPHDGETVTYRHREPRALVVSGTRGDVIFYAKHILSCGDQVWNSVHIEYPARNKAAYDALVTRVARSLRPGRSGQVEDCK